MIMLKIFHTDPLSHTDISCVCVFAGVVCQGHRHLDGRVSSLRLLSSAGVCCRQLCVEATQGAPAIQTESQDQEQGTEKLRPHCIIQGSDKKKQISPLHKQILSAPAQTWTL